MPLFSTASPLPSKVRAAPLAVGACAAGAVYPVGQTQWAAQFVVLNLVP